VTTLQEIEAALPALSAEELARVEAMLERIRRQRGEPAAEAAVDRFCDGRSWPGTADEIDALLAEMDDTPPLEMSEAEIADWQARRQTERERQKREFPQWVKEVDRSFS
jgi:hypothetical protein